MRHCTLLFLLLLVALTPSAVTRAAHLVYFEESPRGLYNFDTETGISTLRCAMTGSERFFGMDMRKSDGALFAVDLWGSGLWNIDINTGQTTRIGTLALDRPEGIAIHPNTGELYISSALGDLYRANPITAAVTLIGQSGLTIRGHSFSATTERFIAFHEGSGNLYSVNPTNAQATLIGPSIPSVVPEDATFAGGRLFGTDFHGKLYEVNPNTGAATFLANTGMGDGLLGLIAVPEPSMVLVPIAVVILHRCARLRAPAAIAMGTTMRE